MKKNYLIIITVLLFTTSCVYTETVILKTYNKKISYYTYSDEWYNNGNIKKCHLENTVEFNGYSCSDRIYFFENGNIKHFMIEKPVKVYSFTVPAQPTIFFYPDNGGKISTIWFSTNVTIGGIKCKGGTKIATEFYENGQLKSCFLLVDQEIQGVQCKSSLLYPVEFHPNGRIKVPTVHKKQRLKSSDLKHG